MFQSYDHHQARKYIVATDPLNRDDFDVMDVYLSHLMMAHEGRNM
jgi:hypothetical protein